MINYEIIKLLQTREETKQILINVNMHEIFAICKFTYAMTIYLCCCNCMAKRLILKVHGEIIC